MFRTLSSRGVLRPWVALSTLGLLLGLVPLPTLDRDGPCEACVPSVHEHPLRPPGPAEDGESLHRHLCGAAVPLEEAGETCVGLCTDMENDLAASDACEGVLDDAPPLDQDARSSHVKRITLRRSGVLGPLAGDAWVRVVSHFAPPVGPNSFGATLLSQSTLASWYQCWTC